MSSELKPFDLAALAENGLRRGRTTGSCAAAAVKAAMQMLLDGAYDSEVMVTLPDQEHYLLVPVQSVCAFEGAVRVEVIKFAGDDPDQTDGATIFAEVRANHSGSIRFIAGEGVGVVTAAGIRVAVGEAAINPAPRRMIELAIEEVLDGRPDPGFDVTIGCINGAEIAKRTFNPRLGIVGGISILGTTGIVEPMSLAAYKAAIEVYIRVALAENSLDGCVAYMPGNLGLTLAKGELKLSQRQIVHISNFMGFAFETTQAILAEEDREFGAVWLLGHPGKIAKILDGHWDTHSQKSPMALATLARLADEIGLAKDIVAAIGAANTAEAVVETIDAKSQKVLWNEVGSRVARAVHLLMPRVKTVHVQLFAMGGQALGGGRS